MELLVHRIWKTDRTTIGELTIDGDHFCYTLEDVVRPPGVKIPKETAIPEGRYRLVIDFSQRYQRNMPHVLDVPMFTGIRLHAGNTEADTEGCVIVALHKLVDKVTESRLAFNALYSILLAIQGRGEEMWITVYSAPEMLPLL